MKFKARKAIFIKYFDIYVRCKESIDATNLNEIRTVVILQINVTFVVDQLKRRRVIHAVCKNDEIDIASRQRRFGISDELKPLINVQETR